MTDKITTRAAAIDAVHVMQLEAASPTPPAGQPAPATQQAGEPAGSIYRNSVTGEFELDYSGGDHPKGSHVDFYLAPQPSPTAQAAESGLPFGIIDPDYARAFTKARVAAWQHGYAIALQGSFTRDLDLVAIPWTDMACETETLVKAIEYRTGLKRQGPPSDKPHGRKAVSLLFPGFEDPRWVDLSILQRTPAESMPAQPSGAAYAVLPDPALRTAHGTYLTEAQARDFADRTHLLRMQALTAAPAMPSDAEIDAFLDSPAGLGWLIADKRERFRLLVRAALAKWVAPAPMTDADKLLDFIEQNPDMSLRHRKGKWAFKGFTNYEYEILPSFRDAIRAAMIEKGRT